MLSERHESFRYEFSPPIECQFNISLEDGSDTESNFGVAEIHNISPHGLMFRSTLHIPKVWESIKVKIKFTLVNMEFLVVGRVRWKEMSTGSYLYGVHLENDDELQQKIIDHLKKFSRNKHNMSTK
nr:PilZ domain-containing protein [Paenibacillus roseus]